MGDACCDDWDEYMSAIDTYTAFSYTLSALPEYGGPAFRYCPWCGTPRQSDEKEYDAEDVTTRAPNQQDTYTV